MQTTPENVNSIPEGLEKPLKLAGKKSRKRKADDASSAPLQLAEHKTDLPLINEEEQVPASEDRINTNEPPPEPRPPIIDTKLRKEEEKQKLVRKRKSEKDLSLTWGETVPHLAAAVEGLTTATSTLRATMEAFNQHYKTDLPLIQSQPRNEDMNQQQPPPPAHAANNDWIQFQRERADQERRNAPPTKYEYELPPVGYREMRRGSSQGPPSAKYNPIPAYTYMKHPANADLNYPVIPPSGEIYW